MPTNNSSDSYIVYLECLNVIKGIIAKYSASHSILLSGDMNGTLKEPRTYNKHDALLQSFIEEINLKITSSDMPTFYHHSGSSTSQIDYIIHNSHDGLLFNYTVNNKCDIHISSHVPVSGSLNINWNGKQIVKKSNQTCIKQPVWDAIDRTLYEDTINKYLRNYCPGNRTTYENLLYVRQILQKATSTAVLTKTLKLKGPKWKASPTVLQLLKICKAKYRIWVENGKQNDKYKVENIMTKRNLRKQMRKEQFIERNKFYNDLMDNPGTVVFHRLINRNRLNRNNDTACITEQTTNHYTTEDQTNCFARYYEDLAVPKDKGYDTATLELRNVSHTLMEDIFEEEAKTHTQVITSEMIQKAVESLNTGKAADEHGLKAEH